MKSKIKIVPGDLFISHRDDIVCVMIISVADDKVLELSSSRKNSELLLIHFMETVSREWINLSWVTKLNE